MFDFRDVAAASKSEQIRAWAVESAIDSFTPSEGASTDEDLIGRAARIEEFVLNGKQDS